MWEYVDPVRGGDQDEFIPVVSEAAQRIDPASWIESFSNRQPAERPWPSAHQPKPTEEDVKISLTWLAVVIAALGAAGPAAAYVVIQAPPEFGRRVLGAAGRDLCRPCVHRPLAGAPAAPPGSQCLPRQPAPKMAAPATTRSRNAAAPSRPACWSDPLPWVCWICLRRCSRGWMGFSAVWRQPCAS